jgi:hypothetical protein
VPYVSRNSKGAIVSLHNAPIHENSQWLDVHHPEVMEFLAMKQSAEQAKQSLSSSDDDMIRVIEDVIDLLMAKQVFMFTELPEQAQQKLSKRYKLRKEMEGLNNFVDSGDETIF